MFSENSSLEWEEVFEFPTSVRIAAYILYNVVFLCGLVGNVVVFYTIHYTHPRMRTIQNYFLANLALGDLMIVILCVPTGYIAVLWQYWPFGHLLCIFLSPTKAVGVFISAYTLVALALDRYMAIIYPLKPGLTKRQAKGVIILIWIAAFLTATPVALSAQLQVHLYTGLSRCGEYGWTSMATELTYNLALLILQYLLPLLVLIYTYTRILLVVCAKRMVNQTNPSLSKGKHKTVVMSLSVVLGYTLAWLPYNLIYLVNQHGPEWILESEVFPYLYLVAHFLAMSHTTFNPIIYFWINSRFRRALRQALQFKCPCLTRYFNMRPVSLNTGPSWRTSSIRKVAPEFPLLTLQVPLRGQRSDG